jgi:hypothetical protein
MHTNDLSSMCNPQLYLQSLYEFNTHLLDPAITVDRGEVTC